MLKTFIVSAISADHKSGRVQLMEAHNKKDAARYVLDMIINNGARGYITHVIAPGEYWPRTWKGPKYYPPRGSTKPQRARGIPATMHHIFDK